MKECKKCKKNFLPTDGLVNYCSLQCRNSRIWTEEDKIKKSKSAKLSEKLLIARQKRYIVPSKITSICLICKNNFTTYKRNPNKTCSRKCYIVHSKELNKNNGGYRTGSGIGKKGRYKGYWCDSSWEFAFLLYHIDNEIPIKRNTDKFLYCHNDKSHNYIPDFIVDNKFYEIKGYCSEQWESKKSQFPYHIEILGKKEIQFYIDYATKKYGSNFIELYEK
jgi:hypothetical protein